MSEGLVNLIGVHGYVQDLDESLVNACRSFTQLVCLDTGINISDFHWRVNGVSLDKAFLTLHTDTPYLSKQLIERVNSNSAVNRRGYHVAFESKHHVLIGLVDRCATYAAQQRAILQAITPSIETKYEQTTETKYVNNELPTNVGYEQNWLQALQSELQDTQAKLNDARKTLDGYKVEISKLKEDAEVAQIREKTIANKDAQIVSMQAVIDRCDNEIAVKDEMIRSMSQNQAKIKSFEEAAKIYSDGIIKKDDLLKERANVIQMLQNDLAQCERVNLEKTTQYEKLIEEKHQEILDLKKDRSVVDIRYYKKEASYYRTLNETLVVKLAESEKNVQSLNTENEELTEKKLRLKKEKHALVDALTSANDYISLITQRMRCPVVVPLPMVQFSPKSADQAEAVPVVPVVAATPIPELATVTPVTPLNISAFAEETSRIDAVNDIMLQDLFNCFFGSCHYNIKDEITKVNKILSDEAKKGANKVTFTVNPVNIGGSYSCDKITLRISMYCHGKYYASLQSHTFFEKTLIGTQEEVKLARTNGFTELVQKYLMKHLGLQTFDGGRSTLTWC